MIYSRCADGYMGQRCEFKDLDGSYLRKDTKHEQNRYKHFTKNLLFSSSHPSKTHSTLQPFRGEDQRHFAEFFFCGRDRFARLGLRHRFRRRRRRSGLSPHQNPEHEENGPNLERNRRGEDFDDQSSGIRKFFFGNRDEKRFQLDMRDGMLSVSLFARHLELLVVAWFNFACLPNPYQHFLLSGHKFKNIHHQPHLEIMMQTKNRTRVLQFPKSSRNFLKNVMR